MLPLLEFDRRHSAVTGVIGGLSGFFSWLLAHSAEVTSFAGMVGAICTAILALAAVGAKLFNSARWAHAAIRKARRNANQRRRFARDEPWEDHLP